MQASSVAWIFERSVSWSLGNLVPRKSTIYLSTLGTEVTSRSGLGCSLNRAPRSSLVRQRQRYFSRYTLTGLAWNCNGPFLNLHLLTQKGQSLLLPRGSLGNHQVLLAWLHSALLKMKGQMAASLTSSQTHLPDPDLYMLRRGNESKSYSHFVG